MGREVRKVPKDWKHPVYTEETVDIPRKIGEYIPSLNNSYKGEATHLQMYETISEGTPISPVMETPEELAQWLFDNGASAFGFSTATYEQWLSTIKRGWAVSAAIVNGRGLISGVEALHEE